jgi:hypothetical protein
MAHAFGVQVRIVPDDPENPDMWPPVMDGSNAVLEDTASQAAARPAALAVEEAIGAALDGTGWHVEIPAEPEPAA